VAGIVAGSGALSARLFTGVAPDADLVGVKVLEGNGSGYVSTVIAGLDWCVQNRAALGIRVINLSMGHKPGESYRTDPLCAAVRRAVQAGMAVVCSAGNKGKNDAGQIVYGGISSPGMEPSAITVGALNTWETARRSDDTVCTFSSRGPTYLDGLTKPDLVAPGNKIVSVRSPGSKADVDLPLNQVDPLSYAKLGTPEYFRLSGTSMAAPQVAGTVALVLQANPYLAPNTEKGILMYSAQWLSLKDTLGQPLSKGLSTLTQGAGSLNAVGAVEVALAIDPSKPVGSPWLRRAQPGQQPEDRCPGSQASPTDRGTGGLRVQGTGERRFGDTV
jgi:serine protease AprX